MELREYRQAEGWSWTPPESLAPTKHVLDGRVFEWGGLL